MKRPTLYLDQSLTNRLCRHSSNSDNQMAHPRLAVPTKSGQIHINHTRGPLRSPRSMALRNWGHWKPQTRLSSTYPIYNTLSRNSRQLKSRNLSPQQYHCRYLQKIRLPIHRIQRSLQGHNFLIHHNFLRNPLDHSRKGQS